MSDNNKIIRTKSEMERIVTQRLQRIGLPVLACLSGESSLDRWRRAELLAAYTLVEYVYKDEIHKF